MNKEEYSKRLEIIRMRSADKIRLLARDIHDDYSLVVSVEHQANNYRSLVSRLMDDCNSEKHDTVPELFEDGWKAATARKNVPLNIERENAANKYQLVTGWTMAEGDAIREAFIAGAEWERDFTCS